MGIAPISGRVIGSVSFICFSFVFVNSVQCRLKIKCKTFTKNCSSKISLNKTIPIKWALFREAPINYIRVTEKRSSDFLLLTSNYKLRKSNDFK